MRLRWFLVIGLILLSGCLFSQARRDSSFSLFFNPGISFTRANDVHINRWLAKYGYPTVPNTPSSYNFELAAMPANSRLLYCLRLSSINSVNNFSSFNFMAGLYSSVVKSRSFLLLVGGSAGLHRDIITLNGQLPPEYQQLATQIHGQLAMRRAGLCLEPAARAFWYPVRLGLLQVGLYGALGYDLDVNSHWKLGYYSNNHGKYGHFKGVARPTDQQKVSEHGLSYNAGLSFRFNLH
jgi:hypothetical protein